MKRQEVSAEKEKKKKERENQIKILELTIPEIENFTELTKGSY